MDLAWILASLSRFWEMSVLWKKSFFCIFSLPHQKKIQVAANRTILKIDALHISHFEAYVPLFSKHLWNLTIRQKLWVSALFEVGWSRTVSPKIGVFRPLFIGPRCPWSDLWIRVSLTERAFADLTDVTLADEDTNSILTDNANRAFRGNVAMQVTQPGGQLLN